MATCIAAFAAACAAWSAWASHRTAKETIAARKNETSPRLVLDRNFTRIDLKWPNPDPNEIDIVPSHKLEQSPEAGPTAGHFSLTNYGGPALAVELIFALDNADDDLQVPEYARSLGLSVNEKEDPYKEIRYNDHKMVLSNIYRAYFASCAPQQPKAVQFPSSVLNMLFLRGVQADRSRSGRDMVLTVNMSCGTVDGDRYEAQARFYMRIFVQTVDGKRKHLHVSGPYISEVPMFSGKASHP